jgi:metal-responsive CopG/Arc/MetJ family transcriptional regulator
MTHGRPVAMQKITIAIPPELLDRLDQSARELGTRRSQLIRDVLGLYLDEIRHQELRDILEEGYHVHAARDVRISEDFRFVDYETTVHAVPLS